MAARAKTLSIVDWENVQPMVDPADSWLDKPVSEWPEGILFPAGKAVYARTLMHANEAKVTFGSYSDGSMSLEEMADTYWNKRYHNGEEPPVGAMKRLDTSVTLNLVELEELKNLVASDDGKPKHVNFSLSVETANPLRRGRVLRKQGRTFKLATVNMYENGGGALRRYESIILGENLKRLLKVLFDRLVWLEEHRRFAGWEQAKISEQVRTYIKEYVKTHLVATTLAKVDQDPSKYGNNRESDWIKVTKDEYKKMDRKALLLSILDDDNLPDTLSALTVGTVRESVIKALTCPEHINSVVEQLYVKGSVLSDKRKGLVEKFNRRKRKLAAAADAMDDYEDQPSSSQDLF